MHSCFQSLKYSHVISNFTLTNTAMEGNTTSVFEGTATVTMRDGPVSGVSLTIRIFNNAVIGMLIGPDKVDSGDSSILHSMLLA